ncbi:hypothetical protein PR048_027650 [Dryococelus australis]|uniref:Uncharacterized protein n=1 Tax=Dryococelus australis TaxID=614101 RepID=A0ABQ9GH35_9NEOP|nr:hypothetical protein PR048_027650 [Dryococelus australis]
MKGPGKLEIAEEHPPISGIVRHDSHMLKSGSDPAGDLTPFASVGGEQANHWPTAAPPIPKKLEIEYCMLTKYATKKQALQRKCRWGRGGVVVRLSTSHLGGPGSIFACGNRAGRCRWSAGFLRDIPFLPPLHSGAASYSPRFTLIDSQDLVAKRRPNLSTYAKVTEANVVEFLQRRSALSRVALSSGRLMPTQATAFSTFRIARGQGRARSWGGHMCRRACARPDCALYVSFVRPRGRDALPSVVDDAYIRTSSRVRYALNVGLPLKTEELGIVLNDSISTRVQTKNSVHFVSVSGIGRNCRKALECWDTATGPVQLARLLYLILTLRMKQPNGTATHASKMAALASKTSALVNQSPARSPVTGRIWKHTIVSQTQDPFLEPRLANQKVGMPSFRHGISHLRRATPGPSNQESDSELNCYARSWKSFREIRVSLTIENSVSFVAVIPADFVFELLWEDPDTGGSDTTTAVRTTTTRRVEFSVETLGADEVYDVKSTVDSPPTIIQAQVSQRSRPLIVSTCTATCFEFFIRKIRRRFGFAIDYSSLTFHDRASTAAREATANHRSSLYRFHTCAKINSL